MKLSQKMSQSKARCLLCPRFCELDEGEIGACNALVNKQGDIYPHNYGVLSSSAIEPVEKKPFKHFMPGTKTLSIGLFGCNLRCKYCENEVISQHEVSEFTPHKQSSTGEVVEVAKEMNCPSVCMTYNEPTVHFDFLRDLGKACHENDLKFIIKTNAYINPGPWEEVCKVTDAMNIDYKGAYGDFEDITECRYVSDYFNKIYIALCNNVHVELSIPVLHGVDMEGYFHHFGVLQAADDDIQIPCHLLKVNPAHLMINDKTTSDDDIERAREDLSRIFKDIYV